MSQNKPIIRYGYTTMSVFVIKEAYGLSKWVCLIIPPHQKSMSMLLSVDNVPDMTTHNDVTVPFEYEYPFNQD